MQKDLVSSNICCTFASAFAQNLDLSKNDL